MLVTYGQPYGQLPEPTRENHTFEGWWTGIGGTGSQVSEAKLFYGTVDQTLYAKWTFNVVAGPAGGLVYYENPNWEADGWRFLEAAPYGWYDGETDSSGTYSGDEDPYFQWGAFGYAVDPSAEATSVGTGASNTANIVTYHDTLWIRYPEKGDYYTNPEAYSPGGSGMIAAKICSEYSVESGGTVYDDWFLPSGMELDLMYRNLYTQNLGGFDRALYWSSSEKSGYAAWMKNFGISFVGLDDYPRYLVCRVRPIRAF
jgi:uncharacterized repeat protein (TIGR02543 family)